ncbi:MAG: cupin domain-containing protein [Methylosarcina sp.]
MDALTALVNALNLHAKLVYSGGVCGRWRMDHNSETSVWFHLVSKGQGFVHSPSWPSPLALNNGDLVLFFPMRPNTFCHTAASICRTQMKAPE